MRRCCFWFCIGCVIGSWIPFIIDQLAVYQDKFSAIDVALGERVTLVSLSPDESMRVLMVERGFALYGDRNIDLRLQKKSDHSIKTIFTLSDQSRPAGLERVVSSPDNSQFILLNRRFEIPALTDSALLALKNGEKIILLHNIETGEIYCRYLWEPGAFECSVIPQDTLKKFQ